MIILKLSFKENDEKKDKEFGIETGELLSAAVTRALKGVPLPDLEVGEIFQVVVNGHIIPSDMWDKVSLKENDSVLISPALLSGESGQIFKQVAIIAITVVATYFAGPAGLHLGYAASAAFVAGVTIAASLALNALIPPPVPDQSEFGLPNSYEESQMYTITGQSNQAKRLGNVPKVYGEHRIFPTLAVNPYTELLVDEDTGELVQYIVAIYDFGLGPLIVNDVKVGDTPLTTENFDDFSINFFDPNRPEEDEGQWDIGLNNDIKFYKGDFQGQPLSIGINGNSSNGDPQDTYEAIRNSAANPKNLPQEISLNFQCPSGLFGFSATGVRDYRSIEIEIHFSKVGEDIWRSYKDTDYVSSFSSVGGSLSLEVSVLLAMEEGIIGTSGSLPTSTDFYVYATSNPSPGTASQNSTLWLNVNSNKLLVVNQGQTFVIGSPVLINSSFYVGQIQSVATYGLNSNYSVITLDRTMGTNNNIQCFNIHKSGVASSWGSLASFGVRARLENNTPSKSRIRADQTTPVYANFKFSPKQPGQYKVRVRRISTTGPYTTQKADDLVWTSIDTSLARNPIATEKRHVFMELRIKARSQLNGVIQNLSAVCRSVSEVYDSDTETWSKQVTSNPAWIFADLLTGEVNKKAIDKSRLHLPSLLEWAEFCDEVPNPPPDAEYTQPRFTTNFVLDYAVTLQTVLNQVANAAQASLNIIDGKYGVLIDRYRSTPVQIFTPRNSSGFSSSRFYGTRPHGVLVKYIDPQLNWEVAEAAAYDDGYDNETATELQDLTSFACTNFEQAWRFGRYMLAQNRLRQDTISINVDFEHLVCTRGDYVQVTQDAMRVGGTPARVKTVAGSQITIDDRLDIDPLINYGYFYRGADGAIENSTLTVIDAATFELDGDIPAVGDLIVIGEVGQVVYDCLVKSITPNDDMSASIVLIEKADAIYNYESSGTLPEYDPQISSTSDPNFKPPNAVENLEVSDSGHDCAGNEYEYFIELIWGIPSGSVFEYFQVYVDDGTGYDEAGQTKTGFFRYIVNPERLNIEHAFKVVAVSASGKKLNLGQVAAVTSTPVTKTTPPSDVERLSTDITNEVLQLTWPAILDCDAKEYLIRYSPVDNGTWLDSIPLLRVDAKTTTASTQARTGTYLIKAIDFNGNESVNAALALTSIPNLFNLNVIEEIEESPAWNGSLDRTVKLGDSIILDQAVPGSIDVAEYYTEGYYYYAELLDLGEIYTVRLQSSIQAQGYTVEDVMENWETLSSVTLMANALADEWDVETQYRSTENLNVMADWTSLSSIVALNEGAQDNFTEWRTFNMGDYTGRIFQFRLKLISNKPSVTPRVFNGTIKADMPDRVESYQNVVVGAVDGYELEYDPPFKGPSPSPNVQVSIDGAQTGDYYEFEYRTLEGLHIRVYDKDGTPVERQVDIAVKGYGRQYTSVI